VAALIMILALVVGPRVLALRAAANAASSASASVALATQPESPRWSPVLDPKLAAAASILGHVSSANGAPIGGALVCADADDPALVSDDVDEPRCATTDATGAFAIRPLIPARYEVSASARGHLPAHFLDPRKAPDGRATSRESARITLAAGETRGAIELTLLPGGVTVAGRVTDSSAGPVAGALVAIVPSRGGDPVPTWVRTDLAGAFAAEVEEGEIAVTADAEGRARGQLNAHAPSTRLSLVLLAGGALEGRVVAETSDGTLAPVPSAVVSLTSAHDADGIDRPTRGTRAGADGRFRVERLVPGLWDVEAEVLGAAGTAGRAQRVLAGDTARDVVVVVRAAHVVEARLAMFDHVGGAGEAPCSGGTIDLEDPRTTEHAVGTAGTDGVVVLRAVAPGSYEVSVSCPDGGRLEGEKLVVDRDVHGLVYRAPRGLALRGVVVDDVGVPVAHASVDAHRTDGQGDDAGSAETDERGRFAMVGLSAGTWVVNARSERHLEREDPASVKLLDATPSPDVRLTLGRGGALEGAIVDVTGAAVAGIDVEVSSDELGRTARATTRDDGTFRVEGLPDGAHTLLARLDDGGTLRGADGETALRGMATTAKGTVARVKLVAERMSGEVHGRVVDAAGAALEGVLVDAHRVEAAEGEESVLIRGPVRARRATTDAEGRFHLAGLPSGVFDVRASRPGGFDVVAPRVASGADVTLTLGAGGVLRGRVTFASGAALRRFRVHLVKSTGEYERSASFDAIDAAGAVTGAFVLDDVHDGAYRVEIEAAEGAARAQIEVAHGAGDVALVLHALATVRGHVAWFDDGQPAVGAEVELDRHDADDGGASVGRWAKTDASGGFELVRVEVGALELRVRGPGDGRDVAIERVVTAAGSDVDLGVVRAARSRLREGEEPGWLGLTVQPHESADDDVARGSSEGRLEITEIEPGGPAAGAGLLAKQVVVEVDGFDVRGAHMPLYRTLSEVPAGTRVRFLLADGRSVDVTALKESPTRAEGRTDDEEPPSREEPKIPPGEAVDEGD
jgi:protocatechuate 3,4-dioxygenase beta subunit